jgi:hypothetical protein
MAAKGASRRIKRRAQVDRYVVGFDDSERIPPDKHQVRQARELGIEFDPAITTRQELSTLLTQHYVRTGIAELELQEGVSRYEIEDTKLGCWRPGTVTKIHARANGIITLVFDDGGPRRTYSFDELRSGHKLRRLPDA